MSQRRLANLLKAVVIGAGICGFVIFGFILPFLGGDIVRLNPEFQSWFWPWLIFLWVIAIPCYAALALVWRIAGEIGRDNSFCLENARRLRGIALLAAADSALVFVGNLVFLLLNMSHPGVVIAALFVVFAGLILTVVSAALSHLVLKAAKLREENDLTI